MFAESDLVRPLTPAGEGRRPVRGFRGDGVRSVALQRGRTRVARSR